MVRKRLLVITSIFISQCVFLICWTLSWPKMDIRHSEKNEFRNLFDLKNGINIFTEKLKQQITSGTESEIKYLFSLKFLLLLSFFFIVKHYTYWTNISICLERIFLLKESVGAKEGNIYLKSHCLSSLHGVRGLRF
jgi:hypothetical protein